MLLVKVKSGSSEILVEQTTFDGSCSPLSTKHGYSNESNTETFLNSIGELCKQVKALEGEAIVTECE